MPLSRNPTTLYYMKTISVVGSIRTLSLEKWTFANGVWGNKTMFQIQIDSAQGTWDAQQDTLVKTNSPAIVHMVFV